MAAATSTIIGLIIAGVSAGTAVYSASEQASTARETAKYNDQAFQAEARNKEALAAEGIRRERQQNRRKIAEIRNSLAVNGTLSTEGTPLAIIGESSANLELGVQDAARAAAEQANGLRSQGAMGLWEGDQQANAANLQGAAGVLNSATGLYSTYKQDQYYGLVKSRKTP